MLPRTRRAQARALRRGLAHAYALPSRAHVASFYAAAVARHLALQWGGCPLVLRHTYARLPPLDASCTAVAVLWCAAPLPVASRNFDAVASLCPCPCPGGAPHASDAPPCPMAAQHGVEAMSDAFETGPEWCMRGCFVSGTL